MPGHGHAVGREPPDCGGKTLVLQIRFPDCWDGVNLDSADHKSHMAYTVGGICPSNYPVPVPLLELNLRYQTAGGPGVTLALRAGLHVPRRLLQRLEPVRPAGFIDFSGLHSNQVCGTVS